MKSVLDKQTHLAGLRLKSGLILLAVVIAGGTVGFHLIEQWPFLDCLYMRAITISTVGFG